MTAVEVATTVIAIISVVIAFLSWLGAQKSGKTAKESFEVAKDARDVATIASCNQRYLDWRSKGLNFDDDNWCYGIWDLVATEFNFFRHGWLPLFIFRFWMNTLGAWYVEYPNAWRTHQSFLETYAGSLIEMEDFFHGIWKIAQDSQENVPTRNRRIEHYVEAWAKANRVKRTSEYASTDEYPSE